MKRKTPSNLEFTNLVIATAIVIIAFFGMWLVTAEASYPIEIDLEPRYAHSPLVVVPFPIEGEKVVILQCRAAVEK